MAMLGLLEILKLVVLSKMVVKQLVFFQNYKFLMNIMMA
jgi:hypothetical protein